MQISNEEMFKRIARFSQLMPMDYKQMAGGEAVLVRCKGSRSSAM